MRKTALYIMVFIELVSLFLGCNKEPSPLNNSTPPQISYDASGTDSKIGICGTKLFTITDDKLIVLDISSPGNPTFIGTVKLNIYPQSLYCKGDTMFIGHLYGIDIYNVSNPLSPVFISSLDADKTNWPIIANDKFAFISFHKFYLPGIYQYGYGSTYYSDDKLKLFDISNIVKPKLDSTLGMIFPSGLAIDNSKLYVCDTGLVIYDLTTLPTLKLKKHFVLNYSPSKILVTNNKILLSGIDGIYQYLYDQDTTISQLSKIKVFPIK